MPPKYSSFDMRIFISMVGAAVSKMIQNEPTPAATISQVSSLAPFTDLRFQARKATKNEARVVMMKKTE